MSLSFVTGFAGAGKSTFLYDYCIDESIKNPCANYLYIVPDQFTMQTQQDIVKRHKNRGIMNIDVLSFQRLSHRIFEETGKPRTPVLDDTGKSLVLRCISKDIVEKMPYLGCNMGKIGYIHEIKSSISEFMQYCIGIDNLDEIIEATDEALLKTKLKDLRTIYKAYLDYNEQKFISKEETLDVLCERIKHSQIVKDAIIVFDGFTGFTPIQEKVIFGLCEVASRVIVSVTYPKSVKSMPDTNDGELFSLSVKTVNRIEYECMKRGIERGEDYCVSDNNCHRFSNNPELAHLCRNLFNSHSKVYDAENEKISVIRAANISAEVDAVCVKINELIRSGDYHYRDIAVVCADFDNYSGLFESRFKELDIPAFIDKSSSIVLNPFIEFIESALNIILSDYSYDSVLRYLRCGFTDISIDEADRFDRYIRSLNLRGSKTYHNQFRRPQKSSSGNKDRFLEELVDRNETRQQLTASLEPLERTGQTAGDYVKALYEFIVTNHSFDKLEAYAENFKEEGDLNKAVEYEQIYKFVITLLEDIDRLIGSETITLREFYDIFVAGIGEIKVGIIPQNVDRILVGDLERTRLKEIKALFVTGVNDGNVPKSIDKGGILSAMERETLQNMELLRSRQIELAPTPRESMLNQQLYLYMNLCKPTDRLFVCFSKSGSDGKKKQPSYLINTLKNIFANLRVEDFEDMAAVNCILSLKDSQRLYSKLIREYVNGRLDEDGERLAKALYNIYRESEYNDNVERINDAAFFRYTATPLAKDIVKALYSDILVGSITRFEQYASCAYAHFLRYAMQLSEEENSDFTRLDLGNICHFVLDEFAGELDKRKITWADFDDETGNEILTKCIDKYCLEYNPGFFDDDEGRQYIIKKLTGLLKQTIMSLRYQAQKGSFVNVSHELYFEKDIELDDNLGTVRMKGKIDRIDVFKHDSKIFVKVIDYKSGSRDLDITDVYYGLSEQLAMYLSKAMEIEKEKNPECEVYPSAMLYYRFKNPWVDYSDEMTEEMRVNSIHKQNCLTGLINSDAENIEALDNDVYEGAKDVVPISLDKEGEVKKSKASASSSEVMNLVNYVERSVKRIGAGIADGDIRISPIGDDKKNSCTYCSYYKVCRFDDKLPGFLMRSKTDICEEEIKNTVMGDENETHEHDYLFGQTT